MQCRKGKDLYLWMSKCPNGPSVKFLVNAGIMSDYMFCDFYIFESCQAPMNIIPFAFGCVIILFIVYLVHTMEELKLTGNHLKGSRPLLTFSSNFDKSPHWQLLKEMITQVLHLTAVFIYLFSFCVCG